MVVKAKHRRIEHFRAWRADRLAWARKVDPAAIELFAQKAGAEIERSRHGLA